MFNKSGYLATSVVTIVLPCEGKDAVTLLPPMHCVKNIKARRDFEEGKRDEEIYGVVRIRFEIDLDPDGQKLKQVLPGIIKNFKKQLSRLRRYEIFKKTMKQMTICQYPRRRGELKPMVVDQREVTITGNQKINIFDMSRMVMRGAFNYVYVYGGSVVRVQRELLLRGDIVATTAFPTSGDTLSEAAKITEYTRCSPSKVEERLSELGTNVAVALKRRVKLQVEGKVGRKRKTVTLTVDQFQFVPNPIKDSVDTERKIIVIVLRIYALHGRLLLDAFSDGNFREDDSGNVVLVDPDNLDAGYDSDSPGVDDLLGSCRIYEEWWNSEYFRKKHEIGTLLISALSMATMLDATFNDDMGTTFWGFVRDQSNCHVSNDGIKTDFIRYLSHIEKRDDGVEEFVRSFVIHVDYLRVLLVARASNMTLSNKPRPWRQISDDEKKKVIIEVDYWQVWALLIESLPLELSPHASGELIERRLLALKREIAKSCSKRYLSVRDAVTTLLWAMVCEGEESPHLEIMNSLRKSFRIPSSCEACRERLFVNPTRKSLVIQPENQIEENSISPTRRSRSDQQSMPLQMCNLGFFVRIVSFLSIYVVFSLVDQHRVFFNKHYGAFLSSESSGGSFLRG